MPPVRRLAAILAADVVGYSRLMGLDEAGTAQALREHRAAADPLITEQGGRIVKTTGDGVLIEFASVVGAVECALGLQHLAAERNAVVATERRMEWRIGVHLGDVLIEGDDILGDGVNIAARLEGIAEPGGICISEDAFRQVRGKVELQFADCGEQSLKNIARPLRVYRVVSTSAAGQPISPAAALPLPDKPSIAVLPFANMSGDPEQEYFVDGVVEEIITAISRLPWLFVIARNSSFAHKGKSPDLRQVGRELGVRYVLEGSLRSAGKRVRITGQLIDTTTGAHIWADRFDGVLDDIFELQDEVASRVAGAIEPRLRQSEIERATRKPTESLDAYDLYLRALAQHHKFTEEGTREAVALLKSALAFDPSYAPAAAMIARCRVFQKVQNWGPVAQADVAEGARLARQAIELGKDDPDALWMGGASMANLAGDRATGEGAVDRALLLNPNSAYAWMARGVLSYLQNRPRPAIEALRHAIRLSPLDPLGYVFTCGLAFSHTIAGEYEEALLWVERSLREQPRYRAAINLKVILYALLSRMDEARQSLGQLQESGYGLTVASYREFLASMLTPEIVELYIDALRKAGLPEK